MVRHVTPSLMVVVRRVTPSLMESMENMESQRCLPTFLKELLM